MKKKVLMIFVLMLLLNAMTVYAGNAIYGYFNGYSKVKLTVNGDEVKSEVPGFIIENTTVLPLRTISEYLGVIIKWNDEEQTADLIKPNVNMQFTANPVYDQEKRTYVVYSPFGKIPSNIRYHFSFNVFSEVDNLPFEEVQIKVVLRDPDDNIVEEGLVQTFDATVENSLQYIDFFKNIDFIKTGNYYVELLIKSESTNDDYLKIGEKLIMVK